MRRIALVVLLALASGCLDQFRGGEGEESLTIRNDSAHAVEVVARIYTAEGDFQVFYQDIVIAPGDSREFVMALRPGAHSLAITTSTAIDERFSIQVPTRGDSDWSLSVTDGGAKLERN